MSDPTAAVSAMVGASFSGAAEEVVAPEQEAPTEKFEFDADFQTRIVYLAAFDQSFMRKTVHLLRSEYFESVGEAAFMFLVLRHWKDYQCVLGDIPMMAFAIKDAVKKKAIREDAVDEIKAVIRVLSAQKLAMQRDMAVGLNSDFVADKIAEWARQQAMIAAVTKSVDLIVKADYAKIEKLITDAIKIGLDSEELGGDYFERINVRTDERADESAGKRPPRGITTGHMKLDALLYHRGWGRKELAVLMGGPKAGKTMALIDFASAACLANFNVLYVTLEVANRIVEERADARFSDTPIVDLVGHFGEVNRKITELAMREKIGRFYIAEFPSGTLSPSGLRALLERHKAKGWEYDLIVVDYADIMCPDYRSNDPIENSKQIGVGLRAVMQEWNAAGLTATQSNRLGFQAVTAKAEHVSEDFNKVRTADLFISINSTEEERRDGKARLYFAAGRNQRSNMTVFIEQDYNRGKFIKAIERVE